MYLKNTAMMIAGRFKRKATSPPSIDARFHSSSCLLSLLNGETCKKGKSKEERNPIERQTTLLKKQTRKEKKEKENASK